MKAETRPDVLLYLRLPPAELPDTQEPLCSLMVQVDWPVDVSPSSRDSGLTLQNSTTLNIALKSPALILKQELQPGHLPLPPVRI